MKALIAALMFVCASGVWAQGKPLACQEDAAAGMNWENGQWKVVSFKPRRFILVLDSGNLTTKSVLKALFPSAKDEYVSQVSCTKIPTIKIRCEDLSGGSLYFNPKSNKGGISNIAGAQDEESNRDSLTVSAFTCQPF